MFGYSPILGFDLSDGIELILNEWDEGTEDERVWLEMLGYFARFASTGDPNGDGALEWPLYNAASDPHLVLDNPVAVGSNAADKCAFWSGEDYLTPELFGS